MKKEKEYSDVERIRDIWDECVSITRPVEVKYVQKVIYSEEEIKTIATEFFYWWYNAPGENAEEGFDEWWKLNKKV